MIAYIKGGETVNSRMASAEGFLVAGFPSAAPLLQSLMNLDGREDLTAGDRKGALNPQGSPPSRFTRFIRRIPC